MLSSDDISFFNVLSKCATLAECARKLDVTPPAVTQRLKALEDRIGIRLIDRSGRSIALTDEGALVATHGVIVTNAPIQPGDSGDFVRRVEFTGDRLVLRPPNSTMEVTWQRIK